MPQIENIWLPYQAARKVDLATAPVGSLIYEFDGALLIVAVRPTGVGGLEAPRAVVSLETFEGRLIEVAADETASGITVPFTIEIDPTSAYAVKPEHLEPGHVITNGHWLGIVVRAPDGKPVTLTIVPALSDVPLVGYRGWRIRAEGTIVFVKPDIG